MTRSDSLNDPTRTSAAANSEHAAPCEASHVDRPTGDRTETIRGGSDSSRDASLREQQLPYSIGHYRVLGLIGRGGMGVVYEAEQERPRRIVALKVIRPGLTSPTLLRRFEQESEVLGRLQHPGIAQVFEAGTADAGDGPQPFFAMERVVGRTLGVYADEERLTTRQRLELLAQICDAVHHAHRKGVVHRDLKPGNILVDETGQPKVLDFGVAHVTESDIQATMQTDVGQIVGTLRYMSPEQVSGDPSQLDTRSDVYTLGVILYEMLAARPPYLVQGKALPEALRVIREEEAPRLGVIDRAFRGDIETIAAQALEKDKLRRYASAEAMAEDIRRSLRDEPILAKPPSTVYQLQKLAKRHRALVSGVAAVFVVLLAGIVVSSWQAVRATRAEGLATRQAAKAEAVTAFLREMLGSADPSQAKGEDLRVRDALDAAAKKIEDGSLADQPEVEAAVHMTLGETYRTLGLYDEADPHLRSAVETRRIVLGPKHTDLATSLTGLAILRRLQSDYAAAESLTREALAIQRESLGDSHADVAAGLVNVANLVRHRGDLASADSLLREALAIQRKVYGADHADVAGTLTSMAALAQERGDIEEAIALSRECLAMRRKVLGPDHPDLAQALNNLASQLQTQGDYVAAEALGREALAIWRRVLGDDHPLVAVSLHNLGVMLLGKGEPTEAETCLREALRIQSQKLAPRHLETAATMSNLGRCLIDEEKYAEAEPLLRESLSIREEKLPPGHWSRFHTMSLLGAALAGQSRFAEAEPLLVSSYEGMKDQEAAPRARKEQALARIVSLYEAWKKPDQVAMWSAATVPAPAR